MIDKFNQNENEKYIIPRNFENTIDVPLTKEGVAQATRTGQFLNNYFKNKNMHFDKMIIKTSPFIRTIMTASCIAE